MNSDRLPTISVILPTKNRVQTLQRSLDHLFADDYPSLEVIVIDAASTDGTVELLKSYGKKISRWVSEPDGGEYFALNKGIALATGEIVKLMSDDDVLRPGSFGIAAEFFTHHPDVDILFGQIVAWEDQEKGEAKKLVETKMTNPERLSLKHWLREKQVLMSLSSFMRRSVYDRIGLLSTEYVCGDMEFWARSASRGIKMGIVPDVFVDYHYTGFNGILTKKWQVKADMVRICARYGTTLDVLHCIWRKYIKPFTYRPVVETIKAFFALFGFYPEHILARRRGVELSK